MTDQERQFAIHQSLQHLKRLAIAMAAAAAPAWRECDLTMAQMKALFTLAHNPAIPVRRLAELQSTGEPAASLLVDRMVRTGLLLRAEDPADRRRALVSLSPKGEELVLELRNGRHQTMDRWLSYISDEELAALERGLRALSAASACTEPDQAPVPVPESNRGREI